MRGDGKKGIEKFWSLTPDAILDALQTSQRGLEEEEWRRRQALYGSSHLMAKRKMSALSLFTSQYKSPMVLVLIFAALLSFLLRDTLDALIILTIIIVSGILGFMQERGANNALDKLLSIVEMKTTVVRDGVTQDIPADGIVPGDIVVVNAGDFIPADCLILESKDLFMDESALTGETFPVEKAQAVLAPDIPVGKRTNSLFLGSHVVSGDGKAVAVNVGSTTEFGKISAHLAKKHPETEFETGIRKFGNLLLLITLLLVISIFLINLLLARPIIDAFLFSLAIAVGLTPQLLPAIISVNLAHGALRMAQRKVIVKRLVSIENFGSMNILCSDKTGTLTEGLVEVNAARDVRGNESEKVSLYAYLNAYFKKGFTNPIDRALLARGSDIPGYEKKDEVPYDFSRRRLSILVSKEGTSTMITKGALSNVLSVCSKAEVEGNAEAMNGWRHKIEGQFEELSSQGFRILGLAYRHMDCSTITKDDERHDIFGIHRTQRSTQTRSRRNHRNHKKAGCLFENNHGGQCARLRNSC